jgi:hypothetical protein
MKSLKYRIIIIATFALLVSCNSDVKNNDDSKVDGVTVVELPITAAYKGNELGIYSREFGDLMDYTLRNKITKHRTEEGLKDHLKSYLISKDNAQLNDLTTVEFGDLSYEKTAKDMMEPTFVNEFRAKNGLGIKEKVSQVSNDIFGKQQHFSIKGNNYTVEDEQYIPKKISINKMGTYDKSINSYRSNRGNLSVQYNVDPKNKNGVLLILIWDGSRQNMNMQELGSLNMDMKNIIAVYDPNDSGTLKIPPSALSKFPKYANITSILMRGNSEIVEKQNKKHYIVTSSEQQERIIIED